MSPQDKCIDVCCSTVINGTVLLIVFFFFFCIIGCIVFVVFYIAKLFQSHELPISVDISKVQNVRRSMSLTDLNPVADVFLSVNIRIRQV